MFAATAVFVVIDLIWLGGVAARLYTDQLGYLGQLSEQGIVTFNIPVGILTQVIIGAGLYSFVSLAQRLKNSLSSTLTYGALAGFVIYATYDLTNLSFIQGWPILITVIDIAWGTTQGFMAGWYGYHLNRKLKVI